MVAVLRNALKHTRKKKTVVASGWVNVDKAGGPKPKVVVTFREFWSRKMPKGAVFNYAPTPYEWS